MSHITSDLLSNTLHMLALARQTALDKGQQTQADQFAPVEGKLRSLIAETRQQPSQPSTGIVGQADFQSLLAAVGQSRATEPAVSTTALAASMLTAANLQKAPSMNTPALGAAGAERRTPSAALSASTGGASGSLSSILERNQIVAAMASGGMAEIEIARQMGLAREEVRLIVNTQQYKGQNR